MSMQMKNKDYHIVRYYRGDEVLFATEITPPQVELFRPFRVERHPNQFGSFTFWYRMDLKDQ